MSLSKGILSTIWIISSLPLASALFLSTEPVLSFRSGSRGGELVLAPLLLACVPASVVP